MTDPESSISQIDKTISDTQDMISSLPRSSHVHATLLSVLAMLYMSRYHWSDDERDLETSILHSTHAVFLPFHIVTGNDQNIISTLFSLSEALFYRSIKYEQPDDVIYCIKCLHFLRDPALEAFGITRNAVTALLVQALGFRMKLEPASSNAKQSVEEMSALCQELLSQTSDLPEQDLKNAMNSFARAVLTGLIPLGNQISQQVIERLREASMCLLDPHYVSFVLLLSFVSRFDTTQSIDDYGNAMAILDEIIFQPSPNNGPSPYVGRAFSVAATLLKVRYILHENLGHLEEAISRCRAYLGLTSLEDPYRSEIIHSLEEFKRRRFEEFGVTNDLPEARSSNAEVVDFPSFSDLAASLTELDAVKSHSMTMEVRQRHLGAVNAMNGITNEADVEEAAKYCRLLLKSLQPHSGDVTTVTTFTLCSSGAFFMHAFELTQNPEYLDESVDVFQGILEIPHTQQWLDFLVSKRLIQALWSRFGLSHDLSDFDEIMRCFPIAVTNTYGKEHDRFKVSCQWALFSRVFERSSTSTAYKSAISLLQDSLVFPPTLEMQHHRLVSMRDHVEKLPLDYASYQVHIGQLKEAIETLEQGRGLLWSELRGMRTSIDQLRRVDSRLAEKFASINQDLEALTTSESQFFWSENEDVNSGEEMDPFSHAVVKQRKLLDERTSLITQIRSLPGFGTFLTSPSFDTLFSAAAHGPVIIINHCEWRCDIIILVYDSPPSYIPTPDDFYDRARSLKDQLSAARKEGLDSKEYEDALTCVLATLYDLVGRPVIQRLNELNVPEQSRIWWCPTSVFCSLPIHAMGPIRSEGPLELYFSDIYIPSYTPTLSALIESRKPGSRSFEKPSILLVAQPDEFMPAAWNEISVIRRLNTTVTTLCSKRATPLAVMQHLQDHRFAHFSCHGLLETGNPFDASFKLYQGGRLKLLEIIRSRLPSAEFAFLSACHTAELTEESIADEGLHLSAAVQYSGFRSVVGTMWAMADIDGQVLAKYFYGSLFSERCEGAKVPYYERTAEALRDAVQELRRRKKVTLERWVNFVHYGA